MGKPVRSGTALQDPQDEPRQQKVASLPRTGTYINPSSYRTVYAADTPPRPGSEWLVRSWKWIRRQLGLRSSSPKLPPHPGKAFPDNTISTSKYRPLTFLPVNLFYQFKRVANFYFLVVVILQFIPNLSEVSGTTTVIPLVLVLTINAFKEGYDDYLRHCSDKEINARPATVVRAAQGETAATWRSLLVGDIVKVSSDEDFPADMILLASSDPDGLCFTETANLDGETNLKLKYCLRQTSGITEGTQLFDILSGAGAPDEKLPPSTQQWTLRVGPPSTHLYKLEGALLPSHSSEQEVPVTAANLLLRGCTLRKTDWVLGMVVYTGKETRISLNQAPAPRKVTQLERHMNKLVLGMFAVQLLLALVGALGDAIWIALHPTHRYWYLTPRKGWPEVANPVARFFVWWIKWVLLLNQLIPISLYVTLEAVKVLQCRLLFNRDRKMFDRSSNTPFNARTTTLNEELGQVQYVLSDKTGTLTQNVMGFVWASIGGKLYGPPASLARNGSVASGGGSAAGAGVLHLATMSGTDYMLPEGVPGDTPHSIALNPAVNAALGRRGAAAGGARAEAEVEEFVMALAVCNTVTPTVSHGQLMYQAESPDEEALVTGASFLGYSLVARSTTSVQVDVAPAVNVGQQILRSFSVLAVLEFNSDRKRMSIIVREEGAGRGPGNVRLICKGADNVIMARLAKDQTAGGRRNDMVGPTLQHLDLMARSGYRTLCVAYRDLSGEEYRVWAERYQAASVALEGRDEKLAEAAEAVEREMMLMGATAVEDKLQDGVPEAIEALAAMGIKTWVLTGDKVETAICIAESCRLFPPDMHVVQVREADFFHDDPAAVLGRRTEEASAHLITGVKHLGLASGGMGAGAGRLGLVVEGAALATIMKSEISQEAMLKLCSHCTAVVFCRVSPLQKAQVTNLVKDQGHVTLGIGDGANDVSMIQAAHIGVGISGREGRAAVLASDFSFAQFKFLVRLLLWHGRQSYKRNSEVVLYAFYKNVAYVLPMLYYGFASGFSAQPLYPEIFISTYNAIWTTYPIIFFALLEQDVGDDVALAHPGLYSETRGEGRRQFFRRTAVYLSIGLWHGVTAFIYPLLTMTTPNRTGNQAGLSEIGTGVFIAVVITANLALALRTQHWTALYASFLALSMLLMVPFLVITSSMSPTTGGTIVSQMAGVGIPLLGSPRFWLAAVFGAPALALLLDLALISCQRLLKPKMYQFLQELVRHPPPADRSMHAQILAPNHHRSDAPYTPPHSSLTSNPFTIYHSMDTPPSSPPHPTNNPVPPPVPAPTPTPVAVPLARQSSLQPVLVRTSTKVQRELLVKRSLSAASPFDLEPLSPSSPSVAPRFNSHF